MTSFLFISLMKLNLVNFALSIIIRQGETKKKDSLRPLKKKFTWNSQASASPYVPFCLKIKQKQLKKKRLFELSCGESAAVHLTNWKFLSSSSTGVKVKLKKKRKINH
jgi:hypothetical protein